MQPVPPKTCGARIGGQRWGLHLVVRGPNPRRSTCLSISGTLEDFNEYIIG